MAQSYFIFKDIDCRAMGVTLQGAAAIIRGEEAVTHVTIPGRSGDLTLTEGEGIMRSYIQTLSISVRGAEQVERVMDWLTGEGELILSGQPNRKQKARVIGAVTLTKRTHNLDKWSGEVQFYCDPVKRPLNEDYEDVTRGGSLINDGDQECFPWIVVRGITAGSVVSFTVDGKTLKIDMTGRTETSICIDSEANMVTLDDWKTSIMAITEGPMPVMKKGANVFDGSNWANAGVKMRRRYK